MKEILLLLFFCLPARWLQKFLHHQSQRWELKNDRSISHFAVFSLTNPSKAVTAWKKQSPQCTSDPVISQFVANTGEWNKAKKSIEDNQRTIFWKFLFFQVIRRNSSTRYLFQRLRHRRSFTGVWFLWLHLPWKSLVEAFWAITWQMYVRQVVSLHQTQ